jgi:hypothetical protein
MMFMKISYPVIERRRQHRVVNGYITLPGLVVTHSDFLEVAGFFKSISQSQREYFSMRIPNGAAGDVRYIALQCWNDIDLQCDFSKITLNEFSAMLPFSGFAADWVFGKNTAEPFLNLPVAGLIEKTWPYSVQVNGKIIVKKMKPLTAYIAAPKHIFYMLALIFEEFARREDVSVLKLEQSAAGGGVGMPSYELEFRKANFSE